MQSVRPESQFTCNLVNPQSNVHSSLSEDRPRPPQRIGKGSPVRSIQPSATGTLVTLCHLGNDGKKKVLHMLSTAVAVVALTTQHPLAPQGVLDLLLVEPTNVQPTHMEGRPYP